MELGDLFLSLLWCELSQHFLKHLQGDSRLHVVGPVKTVQTIGPHHTGLFSNYLPRLAIVAVESKGCNWISYFCDQPLSIMKLIIATLFMKVEELIPHLWQERSCNSEHVFIKVRQFLFRLLLLRQQVQTQNSIVLRQYCIEMNHKWFLRQFDRPLDVQLNVYPFHSNLLEEHRHTPTKLNVRHYCVVVLDDLLWLGVVSDVALVINATWEKSGACFSVRPARYQHVLKLYLIG